MRAYLGILAYLSIILAAVAVMVLLVNFERRFMGDLIDQQTQSAFYEVEDAVPEASPGTIYRTEPLLGAPENANAWRILYHSRDTHDEHTLASAVVIVPTTPVPAEGRQVVAWGHPTTGIARHCAPSLWVDPYILIEGLTSLLRAGYAVVATDYAGLGVEGPASFLIGETEAYSMIDAVRAARALPRLQLSDEVIMWGHSQGGHAALFASELIATYAPELSLKAVAVAAPATDLSALLTADIGDISGVTIGSYAFTAYSSVYTADGDVTLNSILTPEGVQATPEMAQLCILTQNKQIHRLAKPLIGSYVKHDPATTQPWRGLLEQNTPSATAVKAPLFIAQGETDTLIHPDITASFAARAKAAGGDVTYLSIPRTGHGMVANKAVPQLITWLGEQK